MSASSSSDTASTAGSGRYGALIALVVATVAYVPLRLVMESLDTQSVLYAAFYLYGTALQVAFAATIIVMAKQIGFAQRVGKQWLLLGGGVAMYAIGDIIWSVYELFLKIDPYPSIADVFYVAEYVFFLAAIVMAIRAYAGLVPVKRAVILSSVVGALGIAAVYVLLLQPYVFSAEADLSLLEQAVSTLYPVGDVAFMFAPAIALALVVAQLGSGKLARPWWVVVAGALVFALADSLNTYISAIGGTVTPLLDTGWIAANLLFAVAALVAREAYRV